MKKSIKKTSFVVWLSIIILCCTILCGIAGCKDKASWQFKEGYLKDEFAAYIGADYKDAFLKEEFTVQDFQSEYIESIQYDTWYSNENRPEVGVIYIQLKDHHYNKLDEVMEAVNDLPFVIKVEKIGIYHICSTF